MQYAQMQLLLHDISTTVMAVDCTLQTHLANWHSRYLYKEMKLLQLSYSCHIFLNIDYDT